MLEKVNKYEEAKKVLKASTYSDYYQHMIKVQKLRAGFIATIGAAVGLVTGLITKSPTIGIGLAACGGILSLTSLLPVLGLKITQKDIRNGNYFLGKSEYEIIDTANQFIDESNKYDNKRHR